MKYLTLIAMFILITSAQAQPIPPLPLESTLRPENGIAFIGWENDVGADTIVVTLDRADCPVASRGPVGDTGDPHQASTQIPAGPPFDLSCLLRDGDHVYLQRWRGGEHIDTVGPYNVPAHVWLPMIVHP